VSANRSLVVPRCSLIPRRFFESDELSEGRTIREARMGRALDAFDEATNVAFRRADFIISRDNPLTATSVARISSLVRRIDYSRIDLARIVAENTATREARWQESVLSVHERPTERVRYTNGRDGEREREYSVVLGQAERLNGAL